MGRLAFRRMVRAALPAFSMAVLTAVRESARVSEMLHRLGILPVNAGASDGEWIETDGAKELVSYSPIDGSEIARVRLAGAAAKKAE